MEKKNFYIISVVLNRGSLDKYNQYYIIKGSKVNKNSICYVINRKYVTYSKSIGFIDKNITNTYYNYYYVKDYDNFRNKLVNSIRPGNKYGFLVKLKKDDGS